MRNNAYLSLNELLDIADNHHLYSKHGFALVMRHAPRAPLLSPQDVFEADLTVEGRQAAQKFGSTLRKKYHIAALFSSPIRRCVHTAQAICEGYGASLPIRCYWWLFSPFLAPRRFHSDHRHMLIPKIQIFSRDGIEEKAISSIDTRFLNILLSRIKIPSEAGSSALYITHDSTVAPLHALLTGKEAVFVEEYPDYLSGLLLTKVEGQVQLVTLPLL